MNGLCPNCGAALKPQAHFCPRCGAPAPADIMPAAPGAERVATPITRRRLVLAGTGVALFLVLATAATVVFFKRQSPVQTESVAPPPEPEVTRVADAEVTSMTELATQYDTLQRQSNDANKRIADLLARYQRRGGALPPNFGPDLTDEQRALLSERIRQERSGVRNLLQEILDKDKELKELRARATDLGARLPSHVVANDGDRHDRIAMDFLIKNGVSAEKAYQLVSQINLQETILPGFRVWTYYQNGQFGTWVTQGTAQISPQDAQRRVRAALESERDEAKRAAADAKTKADAASAETGEFMKIAEAERSRAEQERAKAEADRALLGAFEKERNTVRYAIGSKKQLVDRKVIPGNMRQVSFERAEMQALNLAERAEIPIDGSTYGLKRIKKITLLPNVFVQGSDYQATVDGPIAVIRLLNSDKFKRTQFIIVLE